MKRTKNQYFLGRIGRRMGYDNAREAVKDKQMDQDSYKLKKRMEKDGA